MTTYGVPPQQLCACCLHVQGSLSWCKPRAGDPSFLSFIFPVRGFRYIRGRGSQDLCIYQPHLSVTSSEFAKDILKFIQNIFKPELESGTACDVSIVVKRLIYK